MSGPTRRRSADVPGVRIPREREGARSAWHLFTVRVAGARRPQAHLEGQGHRDRGALPAAHPSPAGHGGGRGKGGRLAGVGAASPARCSRCPSTRAAPRRPAPRRRRGEAFRARARSASPSGFFFAWRRGDDTQLGIRGLAHLEVAALVAQPLQVGHVRGPRHLPHQDLPDVAVGHERLQQLVSRIFLAASCRMKKCRSLCRTSRRASSLSWGPLAPRSGRAGRRP